MLKYFQKSIYFSLLVGHICLPSLVSGTNILPSCDKILDFETGRRKLAILTAPADQKVTLCLNFLQGDPSFDPHLLSHALSMIPQDKTTPRSDMMRAILSLVFKTEELNQDEICKQVIATQIIETPYVALRELVRILRNPTGPKHFQRNIVDYSLIRPNFSIFLRQHVDLIFNQISTPGHEPQTDYGAQIMPFTYQPLYVVHPQGGLQVTCYRVTSNPSILQLPANVTRPIAPYLPTTDKK